MSSIRRTSVNLNGDGDRDDWESSEDTLPRRAKNSEHAKLTWKPNPLPFDEFMKGDYRHKWRIKGLLVADEPAVVFGPSKVLKTSTIVDACISMTSGKPFLGMFETVRTRVMLVSGESGKASLYKIASRICQAREIDPSEVGDKLQIECSIPPLSDPATLGILQALLAKHEVEILVIDPAYLTLLSGGNSSADLASNLFAMGKAIGSVVTVCQVTGTQLILLHHANSKIAVGDEPGLQHIAYSGFAQFCRQWIGLNRRFEFTHDGKSKLIMVVGGSAGHGGCWHVDIDEGVLDGDFNGRKWEVVVRNASESRAKEKDDREAEKENKKENLLKKDIAKLEVAIRELAALTTPIPATKSKLKETLKWDSTKITKIIDRSIKDGRIKTIEVLIPSGRNGKTTKEHTTYILSSSDCLNTMISDCPD